MTLFDWSSLAVWVHAHPTVMALLVWPLLSALIMWAFKPRSADEYAALPPRVSATLKLVSALGLDPVKALEALKQIATGGNKR